MTDGKKLGQAVQQTLFDRMLPAAVKTFEAGETLTSGPLRLDQTFLYYKDKRLLERDRQNAALVQPLYALRPVRG